MNTLKKILAMVVCAALHFSPLHAQKYEYDVQSGRKIVIQNLLGKLIIKGQSSGKMTIEASGLEPPSEKARGMMEIYGNAVDNTGIGISVTESEKTIYISGASKRCEDAEFVFRIPSGTSLKIDYQSPFAFEDLLVDGYEGELEISTLNPDVELKNITGPVTIHAINGNIKAAFSKLDQNSPSSLTTINGELEVILPGSTPASLKFSTIHGEIYSDCDVEFTKEKSKGDMILIGGNSSTEGELNGGGVEMTLSSINGSIYLRKK